MDNHRPVDKRENYIKRCVALPGDTMSIVDRHIAINGKDGIVPPDIQYNYLVRTNGEPISKLTTKKLHITEGGLQMQTGNVSGNLYQFTLTDLALSKMGELENVVEIDTILREKGRYFHHESIFPHGSSHYAWNIDNYGPILVPYKGLTVQLDSITTPLYQRIIDIYEGNDLRISGSKVIINNEITDSYTFKMDYYFMMGDNRHNSADSRYWGFVPEDHIVGKAILVWLSLEEGNDSFFSRIRWNRIFKWIH